ncbi:GL24575 [Drosophila persimilis]|uniref:trypsin n=1 Tax=Drosophila persimilis TaxID=7234 RepID=B4H632_DROPE|nr:GL24575 [Drosophila persimilis]
MHKFFPQHETRCCARRPCPYDGSPLPDWLQCVDLQIIHNSECASYYGTGSVGDNIICVRVVDGKGTCGGDSGGPLVTHHLDWIRDHTGIAY